MYIEQKRPYLLNSIFKWKNLMNTYHVLQKKHIKGLNIEDI